MHTRTHFTFSPWEGLFYSFLLVVGVAILLTVTGCNATGTGAPVVTNNAPHTVGTHGVHDVQTEAKIVEMENEYIAEKNSQPTHQAEADAKAAKKKQAQEDEAKQAQAAKDQEASKAPAAAGQ